MKRDDLANRQTRAPERPGSTRRILTEPRTQLRDGFAEYAPMEGMRGTRFGSARGVTALRRRTCAHRCQFWRERRRTVLDHRAQWRRQDLDRQLHLGPLP